MNGRTPTKGETTWMSDVLSDGCCVCRLFLDVFTPCEIHHIEGSRKEGAHYKTIGLCVFHHRAGLNNKDCVSRHPYKKEFERRYHTDEKLLELTQERLKL